MCTCSPLLVALAMTLSHLPLLVTALCDSLLSEAGPAKCDTYTHTHAHARCTHIHTMFTRDLKPLLDTCARLQAGDAKAMNTRRTTLCLLIIEGPSAPATLCNPPCNPPCNPLLGALTADLRSVTICDGACTRDSTRAVFKHPCCNHAQLFGCTWHVPGRVPLPGCDPGWLHMCCLAAALLQQLMSLQRCTRLPMCVRRRLTSNKVGKLFMSLNSRALSVCSSFTP